ASASPIESNAIRAHKPLSNRLQPQELRVGVQLLTDRRPAPSAADELEREDRQIILDGTVLAEIAKGAQHSLSEFADRSGGRRSRDQSQEVLLSQHYAIRVAGFDQRVGVENEQVTIGDGNFELPVRRRPVDPQRQIRGPAVSDRIALDDRPRTTGALI